MASLSCLRRSGTYVPLSVVVVVTGQVVTVKYVVIVVVAVDLSVSHRGTTLLARAEAAKARSERVAFIIAVGGGC